MGSSRPKRPMKQPLPEEEHPDVRDLTLRLLSALWSLQKPR
jgi:hypothetical protein